MSWCAAVSLLDFGNACRSSNARGTVNCGAMTCMCSTVDDGEGRAENFVAAHDFVDAPLQDRHVEWRRQSERVKDIEKRQVGQRVLKLAQTFLRDRGRGYPIFSG